MIKIFIGTLLTVSFGFVFSNVEPGICAPHPSNFSPKGEGKYTNSYRLHDFGNVKFHPIHFCRFTHWKERWISDKDDGFVIESLLFINLSETSQVPIKPKVSAHYRFCSVLQRQPMK